MNKNFEAIVLQILKEKLLVSPSFVKVKNKKGFQAFKAQGVHLLPNEDFYFPMNRDLRLFMPYSATFDKNIMLTKDLPEQIVLPNKNQEYFHLEALTFPRKKKDLTKMDKEILKKSVSLKEHSADAVFNIPFNINLRLPLAEKSKILTHEFTYDDVLKALARDFYGKVYDVYYNMYRSKSDNLVKSNFELSEGQEKEIRKKFLNILNSFDAYEIGEQEGGSLIVGYNNTPGLDPRVNYKLYKVLLYRMPTKTQEDKEIKKEVFDKVSQRKREVVQEEKLLQERKERSLK